MFAPTVPFKEDSMTALASSDVTVTVGVRDRDIGRGGMSKCLGVAQIAFGDGALTYPTGGIPLPAIGNFGLLRQMDFGALEPPPGDGYVYKYDRENHKILIYTSAGFTPEGTVSQPTFTGDALAGHTHDHSVTDGTSGNAVTFNSDHLEASGGGTLTSGSESGGTPAGTVSQPAFTGSAVAAGALAELDSAVAPAATTLRMLFLGE